MTKESVTLYYCRGSSDKVYMAAIEEQEGGFIVTFAYGRRGSTLQTGVKTSAPLPYDKAKKIYDALVRSKTAKGYTPGEDGTPYSQTSLAQQSTGTLPQLLNAIDENDVERLIGDPAWWMQEKFDGKRLLIRREKGQISGINRRGLVVSLPEPLEADARKMDRDFILDGEVIGDAFHTFDLLSLDGVDIQHSSYASRYLQLKGLLVVNNCKAIHRVETAQVETDKHAMFAKLKAKGAEGAVFKHMAAPYRSGRPASGGSQLKHKFYATASVIVAGINRNRRSVAIEVLADGKRTGIGNVTVLPSQPIPAINSVIEVRFLYAFPGGSLCQPLFIGVRDDIDVSACQVGQLKFKAKSSDDDEA